VHAIQQRRLRRVIADYPVRTVRHTYGCHPLSVRICDPIAAAWYGNDWPDLREIRFLRGHSLRPGARVFDLGAHQGVVAMMLAREVATDGCVIAVEATPHNATIARENAAINDLSQHITVLNALVARVPGQHLPFTATLNGQVSTSNAGQLLPTVSIDSLAAKFGPPDLVVLDIEGFEGEALAGGSSTLACGATFFVEVHVGCGLEAHSSKEAILQTFIDHRYACHVTPEASGDFRPWLPNEPLPDERFFLIALPPSPAHANPAS
jgi:FkbM family methyltransferase